VKRRSAGARAQEHAAAHDQAGTQQPDVAAVRAGSWSDPATWGGAVPAAGDIVSIGAGIDVVLDVSPPGLNGIHLDGKLSFSNDDDVELTTEWILLRGELFAGSEREPHTANATITLTNNVAEENINGMGDRGILIVGGTLSLHGDRANAWTKLSATAEAGATRIEVLDASEWRVGDTIVLASTDFNPRQAEVRQIAADRESQSRAPILAAGAGVGLLERLEDDLLLLDGNTNAGIGDLERHHRGSLIESFVLRTPALGGSVDAEMHTAFFCELEGIRHQVLEHLLQAFGIGENLVA